MTLREALRKSRPTKYRAVPTWVDGIRFASKREAARYGELRLLRDRGHIQDLVLQERFRLEVNGELICTYVADFSYRTGGVRVVEDAKGVKTPTYRLKKKLLRALLGVEVQEV